MKTKSAVVFMICWIFLLEVMLHFWNIDQVNGIQQKCRIENLIVTSLQLKQGCTISHNCVDIRPTNVSFHLQTPRVERCFPVGTKDPVARTPKFLKSAPNPCA